MNFGGPAERRLYCGRDSECVIGMQTRCNPFVEERVRAVDASSGRKGRTYPYFAEKMHLTLPGGGRHGATDLVRTDSDIAGVD